MNHDDDRCIFGEIGAGLTLREFIADFRVIVGINAGQKCFGVWPCKPRGDHFGLMLGDILLHRGAFAGITCVFYARENRTNWQC